MVVDPRRRGCHYPLSPTNDNRILLLHLPPPPNPHRFPAVLFYIHSHNRVASRVARVQTTAAAISAVNTA